MKNLDEVDLFSEAPAAAASAERLLLDVAGDPAPKPEAPENSPFVDLPLNGEPAREDLATLPLSEDHVRVEPGRAGVAPLSSRVGAFAADSAFVLLLTAAPLLAATAGPAPLLSPRGLWWTGAFAVYLSFFASIVPLVLFGKTVGMALTGLTARGGPERPALTAIESSRRWLGTLLAAAGLGIPLWIRRDPQAPSIADRWSGRPLVFEED